MMIKRSFTLYLLLIILVSNSLGQKKFSPAYDFALLEHRIKTWVDNGYYSGASVILGNENKAFYTKYFGNYNSTSTAYVASAGKWVAVATIASLVDEGKLSWDDKVRKWLPEFKDFKGEATLRQLLSHTAGFIPYQPLGHHPDDYQILKQAVDSIVALPYDTIPGTKFLYGGLAMQVAGRMAEVATGKDWETLFQEKIGIPLHMQLTHFTPVDKTPGHNPMLGGGMRTGLQDYGNFLTMILNNGIFEGKRILSEQSIKEMQADQIHNAYVKMPEFPQLVRAATHHGIYGLGEMREEVDGSGNATLLSSPGWAGAYPWIDKKYHIYGFILTRINNAKDGFNSFLGSPVLPYLVRDAIDRANSTDIKKGFVDAGDAKLYYEELGKGDPLILVHGHSLDHTMWDTQFREFAKFYRVIRYDCRGYGQSTMPDENIHFMHAEDLDKLMQQLNISKVHLVGLSLGGFIVLDYLTLYPYKVLSATLASGNIFPVNGPDIPWTEEEKQRRHNEIAELKSKGIDSFKKEWFNAIMSSGGTQSEHIRSALWKMIYEWEAWQSLHCESRLLLGSSVIEILKKQTNSTPVLVLEGKSEHNKVSEHPQILELLPKAKLEYIEDAGHMMNMERPAAFNKAVLEFLRKVNCK